MLAVEETFKHRVTNVVFMGMGEPMLNMKSVLEAHRCLNKVHQLQIRLLFFVIMLSYAFGTFMSMTEEFGVMLSDILWLGLLQSYTVKISM